MAPRPKARRALLHESAPQPRGGSLEPGVQRDALGAMSACEPKIGRIVGGKAHSKRELDHARLIDVEERDLHLVRERSRREESTPFPWRHPDLPQADAVEFVWE